MTARRANPLVGMELFYSRGPRYAFVLRICRPIAEHSIELCQPLREPIARGLTASYQALERRSKDLVLDAISESHRSWEEKISVGRHNKELKVRGGHSKTRPPSSRNFL